MGAAKRKREHDEHKDERKATDIRLPAELDLMRFDLKEACHHVEDPRSWPEEEPPVTVLRAYGPEAIARVLIKQFHVSIRKASIAYLWAENMGQGTKVTLGKAQKAPARWAFLAEVDFVIVFNHAAWRVLTEEQKIALVDHELEHCEIDGDGKPGVVPHDIEEFGIIVKRWGLWKPDLQSFGDAVKGTLQMDLWTTEKRAHDALDGALRETVRQINGGALGENVTASFRSATEGMTAEEKQDLRDGGWEQKDPPPAASTVTPIRAD